MKGTIFSIEEFAVHDGDGVRINVFFKGCPLRCRWCHNPEGWDPERRIVKSPNGCLHCGICTNVCTHKETGCVLCRECMYNCPRDLIRISGVEWESEDLAKKLLSYEHLLKACKGGLTFSGGEVMMQSEFLCEVLEKTSALSRVIETSGYGKKEDFARVLKLVDFVFYDLKIMDSEKHKEYTGVTNELILENAGQLMASSVPFTVRIPVIDGVNSDEENMRATCEFVKNAENLVSIELLPYNEMAGAKYALAGMEYKYYHFKQPSEEQFKKLVSIIKEYNIPYGVRGKDI